MKHDRDYYIKKAIEMSVAEPGVAIHTATDAWPVLKPHGLHEKEHFVVMTLNGAHEVLNVHTIGIGILNKCVVHPREVFRPAIADNSAAIIVAHNHPSGQMTPSEEDKSITQRLRDAGDVVGICVLDHLILTEKGYFSFCEAGI